MCFVVFLFFKQKTAYEMRISDWSSDVCSSDLMSKTNGGLLWQSQRELVWGSAELWPLLPCHWRRCRPPVPTPLTWCKRRDIGWITRCTTNTDHSEMRIIDRKSVV